MDASPYPPTEWDKTRLWDRVAALAGEPATLARLAYQAGLTSRPERLALAMAQHLGTNVEAREVVRLMYRAGLEDGDSLQAQELVEVLVASDTSMTATITELERIKRRKQADAGYIGTAGPRDPANDRPAA